MSASESSTKLSNLWWLALGIIGSGCLDPLIEDPGVQGPKDMGNVPIPVAPNVSPAGTIGGSAAASSSTAPADGVTPTAGATATTTNTTATTTATTGTATGPAGTTSAQSATSGASGAVGPGPVTSDDEGATGSVPTELDAAAPEEDDAGDAGPEGGAHSTGLESDTTSAESSGGNSN